MPNALATLALAASLSIPSVVRSQRTIIVDSGGNGQFRDIPAAIQAAQVGDTLVCRKGSYTGFTCTFGIRILGEPGAAIELRDLAKGISIRDIGRGQRFVLAGFSIRINGVIALVPPMLVSNCAGAVQFEDLIVRFTSMPGSRTLATSRAMAVSVTNCQLEPGFYAADSVVTVVGSTLGANRPASFGINAVRSRIDVASSTITGGLDTTGRSSAFPGILANDCTVVCRAPGTSITGGVTGPRQLPALDGGGSSQLVLDPAVSLVGPVTGFRSTRGDELPALQKGPARVNGTSTLTASSKAGDLVALYFALPDLPVTIRGIGDLWLDARFLSLLAVGVVDPRRTFSVQLKHTTASALRGLPIAYQVVRLRGNTLELSNPVLQVLQ